MPKTNNRKNEHVSLSEKFHDRADSSFKDIRFVHHSLPQRDVRDVDLSVSLGSLQFSAPFFINAMSGGSVWTGKVNEKLATIARETDLAMATGSVSAALKDPAQADTFKVVRQTHPSGLIFANLGAGHGLENAKRAVDLLDADALQIHLNAPQEIVMPEGDREFSKWLKNLESIVNGLPLPVIVKEVGFGMSRETVELLESIGVKLIDVSGRGGTNFAQIENYRRKDYKLDDFEAWGQSTVVSLLEAQETAGNASIIASGGIRRPMEIVKSLALGASINGLSSQIMHMALDDVDQTITVINNWKEEIRAIMTMLGAASTEDLRKTDLIISGTSADWCEARNIDRRRYSFRSENR